MRPAAPRASRCAGSAARRAAGPGWAAPAAGCPPPPSGSTAERGGEGRGGEGRSLDVTHMMRWCRSDGGSTPPPPFQAPSGQQGAAVVPPRQRTFQRQRSLHAAAPHTHQVVRHDKRAQRAQHGPDCTGWQGRPEQACRRRSWCRQASAAQLVAKAPGACSWPAGK